MSVFLTITPRDPIVARDGRPFGAGQATKMRTVSWPYPQMLAGSARTLLGKLNGDYEPARLLDRRIRGPLPQRDGQLCFQLPLTLSKTTRAKYSVAGPTAPSPVHPISPRASRASCQSPNSSGEASRVSAPLRDGEVVDRRCG